MQSKSLKVIVGLLVLFLALSLGACAKNVKKESVKDGGKRSIETSADGKKITIKSEEGEMVIDPEGVDLPDNWPDDMPTFPKAKILSAVKNEGTVNMAMASFQTGEAISAVTDFYDKELPENGWSIDNRIETGPATVIHMASKGDRIVSISTAKDEASGETMISITLGSRPQ